MQLFKQHFHFKNVTRQLMVIVIYVLLAKIGLFFALKPTTITIFWPAGGFALAVLILGGLSYLPAIFIGGIIAGFMVLDNLWIIVELAIANLMESFSAYYLLTRLLNFNPALESRQDFIKLALLAAAIASTISAFIGPTALLVANIIPASLYPTICLRWWMADVLGIAFITTLILTWRQPFQHISHPLQAFEILVIYCSTILVGQVLFFDWFQAYEYVPQGLAWLILLIIWAGLRAGRHITSVLQLIIFIQALWSSSQGQGHYADDMVQSGLFNFWMFGMTIALGGMAVAVISFEINNNQKSLRDSKERLDLALSAGHQGWFDVNLQSGEIKVSPEYIRMIGYQPESFHTDLQEWTKHIHPNDLQAVMEKFQTCLASGGPETMEYRRSSASGDWLWISSVGKIVECDVNHQPVRMIGTHTNITARKILEEELKRQAHIDYLTGVFSRRYFMEQAELELMRAIRYGNPLSLIMLDIDFFKQINDHHGHKAGDAVLVKLGEVCQSVLREVDMVGRVGGEEFAVLLPETDKERAADAAERLRDALANTIVLQPTTKATIHFTVSIGVASLTCQNNSLDRLFCLADQGLYQAKNSGRNIVCVAMS